MLCPFFLKINDTIIPAIHKNGMIKDIMQEIAIKVIYSELVASMVLSDAICKSQLNNERGIYVTPKIMLKTALTLSSFFIFLTSYFYYIQNNRCLQDKNRPAEISAGRKSCAVNLITCLP